MSMTILLPQLIYLQQRILSFDLVIYQWLNKESQIGQKETIYGEHAMVAYEWKAHSGMNAQRTESEGQKLKEDKKCWHCRNTSYI